MSSASPLEERFAATLAAYPAIPPPTQQYLFALKPDADHHWPGKRRWRFDFAWPDLKIAVEIEGIYGRKSRHLTVSGFHNDCDKLNIAAQLDWRVLKFTSQHLKTDSGCKSAVELLRKIIMAMQIEQKV